jgi:hypothetical protein
MAKYRKTSLIEATQWFGHGDHPAVEDHNHVADRDGKLHPQGRIATLEGYLYVQEGDWIAGPGAAGEYWPIKPDIFAATYEPAE